MPIDKKYFAFSFSAVSLFFLPVWYKVFTRLGSPFFNDAFLGNHLQIPVEKYFVYGAGIVVIVGLSLLLGIVIKLAYAQSESAGNLFVSTIAIGLVMFAANSVRIFFVPALNRDAVTSYLESAGMMTTAGLALLAGAVLIVVIWLSPRLARFVLIGLPIGVISLANAAYAVWLIGEKAVYFPSPSLAASAAKQTAGYRVVWIIFDEFDYRLGFEKRPDNFALENLDRLADRSFVATNAKPPHSGTLMSIPSLLIGETIAEATFDGDGLSVRQKSTDPDNSTYLRSIPTIFQVLRNQGMTSSILGQDYLPYCRTFARHLSRCAENGETWTGPARLSIKHVEAFLIEFLALLPVVNRIAAPQNFDPGGGYRRFLELTKGHIVDPDLALIFMHWMIPHVPYIYDRRSKRFTYGTEEPRYYFDNMVLVDLTTQEILNSIRNSPTAANTVVIVSSDHHWRRSAEEWDGILDYRVPFIVMLPGQPEGFKYDAQFDTVVTRSLVEALIRGDVRNYGDIAEFISGGSPPAVSGK